MKDLFTNLYNKMFSFFHQTESKQEASKSVACNRLKLVLMQDRTNLSPAIMERMRKELIDLLSKYLELDRELLELNFEQEEEQMALMLSIPVIRAKDEEEIQEILRKEDEALAESEEDNEFDETEVSDEEQQDDTDTADEETAEVEEKVTSENKENEEKTDDESAEISKSEEEVKKEKTTSKK